MYLRQSADSAPEPVYVEDSSGTPVTGGVFTAACWKVTDGSVVTAPSVVEIAGGFYRLAFAAQPTADVVVRVDTGLAGARYLPAALLVGRYTDRIDATVTSRSSQATQDALSAAVTALGAPAQAGALSALSAAVSALGTPSQASALASLVTAVGSPAQAAVLAADLSQLLAAIATRATPADVRVSAAPTYGGRLG